MQPRLLRQRRASVSVEMALVTVFILFPLLAGLADFLFIVAAEYQLDGALRTLYAYAWNNPQDATDLAQLQAVLANINQHSLPQIVLSTPAPAYSYGATGQPPWGQQGQTVAVSYSLAANVAVPVPLPFGLTNPFKVTASGTVQLQ